MHVARSVTGSAFILLVSLLAATAGAAQELATATPSGPADEALCLDLGSSDAVDAPTLGEAAAVIERRLLAVGVTAPRVLQTAEGVTVEVPAEMGVGPVRSLIVAPGHVEFMPVPAQLLNAELQGELLPDEMADIEPLFDSAGIASATVTSDDQIGAPAVHLTLTDDAARIFDAHAAGHLRERFAIVVDNVVHSAPSINAQRFGGEAQITGDFEAGEAEQLAAMLGSGPLPAELIVVSERDCNDSAGGAAAP